MWQILTPCVERVEFACQFIEIKAHSVRLMGQGGCFNESRVERNFPHQRHFSNVAQRRERSCGKMLGTALRVERQGRQHFTRVTEYRLAAGVTVLNVKYRIVARLLNHLGQIRSE